MDAPDLTRRGRVDSPRPLKLIQRLAWLYGSASLAVIVLLGAAALPAKVLPRLGSLAREVLHGGLAGMVLSALLLALTGLLSTYLLTVARHRYAAGPPAGPSGRVRWSFADPGFAARQGQALVISLGTLAIVLTLWLLGPRNAVPKDPLGGNIAAAFVFAVAFVSLIAERVMNAFPAPQLPEAPLLRRQLLLVTVVLAAAACAQFVRDAHQAWAYWSEWVILWVPFVVALELLMRALGRMFLPPPEAQDARAVADSAVVALLTGGARAPGTLVRQHFGLDFARSWALSFLSAALLPALFGTAVVCWTLSGLKLIDLSHRGVYERFGAPVAILGPGLHLLLPWPFGHLRLVEYGQIHSVPIGVSSGVNVGSGGPVEISNAEVNAKLQQLAAKQDVTVKELPAVLALQGVDYTQYREALRQQLSNALKHEQPKKMAAAQQHISAEATPPLSFNRLWTSVHPDQASYLVASQGTGEQGFQSVSTEIFVLYRVGLTNEDALRSIYTVADPAALIRDSASRLVLRFFNSRTLEEVLGAQRTDVAHMLRQELTTAIKPYHTGIDIVSVLIEEIHPPPGAAQAYHMVQAAQINANASIADAIGRAHRVAGKAQQEAHQLVEAATATSYETRDAANAQAYQFTKDLLAYRTGGKAFLQERYYGDITAALSGRPLTLIDSHLNPAYGPILDMRPNTSGAAAAAVSPPKPAPAPGFAFTPAFTDAD